MIHLGDNRAVLPTFPPGSVDLIFTDPPYNIGEAYTGYDDRLPSSRYLAQLAMTFRECDRVLRTFGSIVVVQGDAEVAGTATLLKQFFYQRQWCIWHYTFGVQCTRMFARSHVHVLHFTKSATQFTFNSDAVRIPSDRQRKYHDPRANPKGKLPDDVMTFSRLCGTFKERRGTPNQLPEALAERFILALSNPGDVVLDPFCGSGTVPAVAKRLGRKGVGIELVPDYHRIAETRFNES